MIPLVIEIQFGRFKRLDIVIFRGKGVRELVSCFGTFIWGNSSFSSALLATLWTQFVGYFFGLDLSIILCSNSMIPVSLLSGLPRRHCGVVGINYRPFVSSKFTDLAAVPFLVLKKIWVFVACWYCVIFEPQIVFQFRTQVWGSV